MMKCRLCSQRLTRPGKLCRECEHERARAEEGATPIEGLETVSQLRRQHVRTKVVVVSGVDRASEYLHIARRLGADAAFEKSRPISELLTLVGPLLQQAREDPMEACNGK